MTTTGSDIEATCSKCGEVWHVIEAMVGDQIAKVQCKECGKSRKFRPKTIKRPAVRKTTTSRAKKVATAVIEADMTKDIRPYSMRDTYAPGERVEHPKFGLGVVEVKATPNKMEVRFPDARRVLVMART